MARHAAHDELVAEVARWYRESTPEMGYELVEGGSGGSTGPRRPAVGAGRSGRA